MDIEMCSKAKSFSYKRAKMTLYCSPEYQTSEPKGGANFFSQGCNFCSGEIYEMATVVAIFDFQLEWHFWSTSHFNPSYQVSSKLALQFRSRSAK